MGKNELSKATLLEALIPIICLILFLAISILKFEASPHIPLIGAAVVAALVALKLGSSWSMIEKSLVHTITMSMQAILILMIVGMLIGTWIMGGIVPTMIYYGLKIISPGFFLVAACLICAIVSLATGTSWGTAGTVGIALIGIGQGLGIPLPMVAGAIISGAYFGDKMSPLSDTTNLAPAMAGSTLFEHVKHMVYTAGPSLVIALVLYGFLGARFAGKDLDISNINLILDTLMENFRITPLLLIPPIAVILMVAFKVPAIPGLLGGVILGILSGVIVQGSYIGDLINVAHFGFESATGIEVVDDLLSRGGLDGMMYSISLVICALAFGGIMEKSGLLETLTERMLTFVKSTGTLVLTTVFSCIFTNVVMPDQYLSIVLPGRMFKGEFDKRKLHPKNLSRCLEDSGTLTSALIPWNTCGAYMLATLGVSPLLYAPFAFLNLLNPLISIIYGFTGFTMEKMVDSSHEALQNAELTL